MDYSFIANAAEELATKGSVKFEVDDIVKANPNSPNVKINKAKITIAPDGYNDFDFHYDGFLGELDLFEYSTSVSINYLHDMYDNCYTICQLSKFIKNKSHPEFFVVLPEKDTIAEFSSIQDAANFIEVIHDKGMKFTILTAKEFYAQ
jgi:hypothetical protein